MERRPNKNPTPYILARHANGEEERESPYYRLRVVGPGQLRPIELEDLGKTDRVEQPPEVSTPSVKLKSTQSSKSPEKVSVP